MKNTGALWFRLFGEKLSVWVVMYIPEDEDNVLIGIYRTKTLAQKGKREDAKEFCCRLGDYSVFQMELVM